MQGFTTAPSFHDIWIDSNTMIWQIDPALPFTTDTPVVRGDGYIWGAVFAEMNSALDVVPPALRSHHVFNTDSFGSFLIFAGVHPMVDDRAELYGDGTGAVTYPTWFDEKGIDWTFDILNSSNDVVLNTDQRWVSLYRGNFVSVHARKSALDAVKGGS